MPTIRFCPQPNRYGVMRIDPVASVKHLDDVDALASAHALQTKHYLVYIEEVRLL